MNLSQNDSVMSLKRTLSIVGLSSSLVGFASAEIESSISAGYNSQYVYRGVDFGDDLVLNEKDIKEFKANKPCKACELLNTDLRSHSNSPNEKADQYEPGEYWGSDLGVAPVNIPGYDGSLYILLFLLFSYTLYKNIFS